MAQNERSRRSLWENFAFTYLQKVESIAEKNQVAQACAFADLMLGEHDKRWKIREELRLPMSKRP